MILGLIFLIIGEFHLLPYNAYVSFKKIQNLPIKKI